LYSPESHYEQVFERSSVLSKHTHILLATLGGQPQIVTFTLDLLLQAGYPIAQVIVLHPATSHPRLQHSLQLLRAEFAGNSYQPADRTIQFHSQLLELDGTSFDDINDDARVDGTLNTIHRLIGDLKRQEYRMHLSVSGGRRLMSLLAISVASFNFDHHDHIWHLYTPDALKEQADEGKLMHAPANAGIKLLRSPFPTLGAYMYNPLQSFRSAQETERLQRESQERACCVQVERQATPAQRRVLQAFAKGLRPQQVADELFITLATVNTHKTALLSYCHNAWNIPLNEQLDYHFLRAKFADHFHSDM
jgi:CRISPR-associated protein Csx14